ncbi:uncharacterized protein LOC124447003 [Xenia sp. Carnegie-2017]|uniref:uncharacterized protein LOC124447003 n=1 Tax=Xenia sp. Carnegie-2017 TaxID=2897299 RepID=UPI001F035D22|nr:uncharacterized protein LOC124447003 [Xenia sp. Carnegie-2017]
MYQYLQFCPVSFKKKGCYRNNHHGDYHLHELLFTDRDSSSSAFSGIKKASNDLQNYVLKLICRCAEKANQNQFTYFAIQHNGDCKSGDQTSLNNYKSVEKSKACISHDLSPCEDISSVCVGKNGSNFVYEITGGPGPEKKSFIAFKETVKER